MSGYGTPFVETEIFLAVTQGDHTEAEDMIRQLSVHERRALENAAGMLERAVFRVRRDLGEAL